MQGSPFPGNFQIPMTPSPFYHPNPVPRIMEGFTLEIVQPGSAMHGMAFGDFGLDGVDESDQQAYNFGESGAAYNGMQYDPNTGACYDYSNWYMPYDNNCYGMMDQDGMMDLGQIQDGTSPEENTQVLLAALGEKIGESQIQLSAEAIFEPHDSGVPTNGNSENLGASGQCELNGQCELELDGQAQKECWDASDSAWGQKTWECSAVEDHLQNGLDSQQAASHRRGDRPENMGMFSCRGSLAEWS